MNPSPRPIDNDDIYRVCEIAHQAREGHIGSSLSILNILNVVYGHWVRGGVTFILSKGHASLGLYIILNKYGLISDSQLTSFCRPDSILGGHPDCLKVPGIFGSTGSLGHGLPLAVGRALAQRASSGGTRIVVLVGDGEVNEGTHWECFLLAAHHKLDNLVCVVDFNGSSERALSVKSVPKAVSALGWEGREVDGHDEAELAQAIFAPANHSPRLVWARTVKGRGVSYMEGNPEWHHKWPSKDELLRIKTELGIA